MTLTNFSKAKQIPNSSKLSTKKSAPTTTNFAKGIFTYKPNDAMDYDEIYLAQNARFDRIGEYKTRRGLAKLIEPLNRQKIVDNYTTTYDMVSIDAISTTGEYLSNLPLCSWNLTLAAETEKDYGIVQLIAKNTTGEIVGLSCAEVKSTTPTDIQFDFKNGVSGNVTWTLSVQGSVQKSIKIAVLPGTTTLMKKAYCATPGKVISTFEANINGSISLLFAFKYASGETSLYRVATNGDVSYLRQLPSGVEKVRFLQTMNKIRYADGKEGPRLIDPASNWSDTAITTVDLKTGTDLNIKVSNILEGTQDNIMYFDADTTTQVVWTYPYGFAYNNSPINSYDKFDRDFRQNFPAIDTGDPLTAMFNLGGVVYFLTRRNKYYMYSQTADVWTQQASSAQHGTFTQESCICDLNYAYYANDDGIYIFDGSSEASITEKTIQSTYDSILGKESISLELYNNRLYVFYSSTGNGINDSCLVYNVNLRLWESFDTGTCVCSSSGRKSPSNRFICGSSHFPQLFLYEDENNDYADLGAPIDFDLETAYLHFGTPSQLHRITKWRPEFSTVNGDWTIKCGYALDFTDDVKYAYSINLKNNTIIDEHYVWDNPSNYGNAVTPTKFTTIPKVYGQFRRCQLRYQLHSAFTPVNFKSHTVTVQTERIR